MPGLRGVRRARPRPALRDGAHAAVQRGPPVAARAEPGVLLSVALRSAAFGFGVRLLRTGWGRRRSDRGTEVGEQEHGAQSPRGRAVGQPEGQRHLRAGPSGAVGRPALCTLTSCAAQPQPWRDPASSPASGKLDGHSTWSQRMEWRPSEVDVRTRERGRVRRTSFSRSDQSKPLTLQSREGLTTFCRLGLHVNREPLLQAGPG